MSLNESEMCSNGIKITFYFKKLQKSPSGKGARPQTPKVSGGWKLRPQTHVCDRFELH